jgi:hypothetical protein
VSTTTYRRLLQLTIVAMTVAIAFMIGGQFLFPPTLGPAHLSAFGSRLWIVSHGSLHELDERGKRVKQHRLSAFGLSDTLSEIRFTAADTFWAHDNERVLRCTVGSERCVAQVLPEMGKRRDNRKILPSADELSLWVADASEHQVLLYERASATAAFTLKSTFTEGLRFPNQMQWQGADALLVNTNGHRIVRLKASSKGRGDVEFVAAIKHRDLRTGRRWPFALTLSPDASGWALVADDRMRDADLISLNSDFSTKRVVSLSRNQDPMSIAWFADGLVVADPMNFQLWRVSGVNPPESWLVDSPFAVELKAAQNTWAWQQRLPKFLIAFIALCVGLGAWFGHRAGEFSKFRSTAWNNAASGASPNAVAAAQNTARQRGPVTGVHALKGVTLTRRWVVATLGLLCAAFSAALLYMAWPYFYTHDCAGRSCDEWGISRGALLLVVVLIALTTIATVLRLRAIESARIGTDGTDLLIFFRKRWHVVNPAQATLTRNALLFGHRHIALRINGAPQFDAVKLQIRVFDRLPSLHIDNGDAAVACLTHLWSRGGAVGRAKLITGFVGLTVHAGIVTHTIWQLMSSPAF